MGINLGIIFHYETFSYQNLLLMERSSSDVCVLLVFLTNVLCKTNGLANYSYFKLKIADALQLSKIISEMALAFDFHLSLNT